MLIGLNDSSVIEIKILNYKLDQKSQIYRGFTLLLPLATVPPDPASACSTALCVSSHLPPTFSAPPPEQNLKICLWLNNAQQIFFTVSYLKEFALVVVVGPLINLYKKEINF
jgi:hypothetical protein